MTGGRTAVVPQTYHDRVTGEAFSASLHPIGDPLSPSCSIYTHKAVKSGNWSDPTVWDTGTVPGANAVVCSGEFDIVYDVLSNTLIKDIHINGRGSLSFSSTQQTRLWVDTLAVDGRLIMGYDAAPIPDSGIVTGGKREPMCEIVFWQSEAPLATARLGLNTMGPVRIHGARKEAHLQVNGSVLAGATSCTLRQNAGQAGWKVGDEIMFVGTEWAGTTPTDAQYSGPTQFNMASYQGRPNVVFTQTSGFMQSQTEVRTITTVSGTTIEWSTPLAFNHLVETDTLPRGQVVTVYPVVAILTQSVRLRTADVSDTVWTGDLADLQKRAHAMFMFDDDIQIRNAEFKNMGRTASDPSLNGPDGATRYATSGTSQPITNVNNIFGRYALHIHRTGAFFGRKQVAVQRCSVWAPTSAVPIPGWSIVHHDSRAAIDECNVYNFRGAGIVSETGNEIGQWVGNVVAWGRGDGFPIDWGSRAEYWINHNGHTGVAFESQARQILQQDNYAEGVRHGWIYMQQDVDQLPRIPDADSLRYRDPITQGGRALGNGSAYDQDSQTYGIEQAQVPDFFRNVCWNAGVAFWKAHQVNVDRADPIPFVIKESHWLNCWRSYGLQNYTFHYYVYDSLWTGTGSGTAAFLGPVMWANNFINMKVKDFGLGFADEGYSIAYQAEWLEVDFENVGTPFAGADELNFGVDPTTRTAWNVMGGASVTGATTGIPRAWAVIRDENLPTIYPAAPFGPDSATRAANPCPELGEAPYVVLDPASDITLTPTGTGQYSIKALIVDSMGYRWHGDHQSPETTLSVMTPRQSRPGTDPAFATGTDIARRNGVFNDGGTWKTRAWFNDIDRATGDHFQWYIDFVLSGGFDSGFLAANTVDPNATRPVLPLVPERLRTAAIVPFTTPPAIATAASQSVLENTALAIVLRADTGKVRWAITGGADAADFEVLYTGGQWVLRWAGNGTKDFEAPDDTGANNVYDVTVTATDFWGNQSALNIAVTVTDMAEAVTEFSDNFTAAVGTPLDTRFGYERVAGKVNGLVIGSGNALATTINSNGTIYRLPDIGRVDNFRMSARYPTNSNVRVVLGNSATNGQRLSVDYDNLTSRYRVIYWNPDNNPVIWVYPQNFTTPVVRLSVNWPDFGLFFNGVRQTPTSGPAEVLPASFPAGMRFFLINPTITDARNSVLDDLYIGPA